MNSEVLPWSKQNFHWQSRKSHLHAHFSQLGIGIHHKSQLCQKRQVYMWNHCRQWNHKFQFVHPLLLLSQLEAHLGMIKKLFIETKLSKRKVFFLIQKHQYIFRKRKFLFWKALISRSTLLKDFTSHTVWISHRVFNPI